LYGPAVVTVARRNPCRLGGMPAQCPRCLAAGASPSGAVADRRCGVGRCREGTASEAVLPRRPAASGARAWRWARC